MGNANSIDRTSSMDHRISDMISRGEQMAISEMNNLASHRVEQTNDVAQDALQTYNSISSGGFSGVLDRVIAAGESMNRSTDTLDYDYSHLYEQPLKRVIKEIKQSNSASVAVPRPPDLPSGPSGPDISKLPSVPDGQRPVTTPALQEMIKKSNEALPENAEKKPEYTKAPEGPLRGTRSKDVYTEDGKRHSPDEGTVWEREWHEQQRDKNYRDAVCKGAEAAKAGHEIYNKAKGQDGPYTIDDKRTMLETAKEGLDNVIEGKEKIEMAIDHNQKAHELPAETSGQAEKNPGSLIDYYEKKEGDSGDQKSEPMVIYPNPIEHPTRYEKVRDYFLGKEKVDENQVLVPVKADEAKLFYEKDQMQKLEIELRDQIPEDAILLEPPEQPLIDQEKQDVTSPHHQAEQPVSEHCHPSRCDEYSDSEYGSCEFAPEDLDPWVVNHDTEYDWPQHDHVRDGKEIFFI